MTLPSRPTIFNNFSSPDSLRASTLVTHGHDDSHQYQIIKCVEKKHLLTIHTGAEDEPLPALLLLEENLQRNRFLSNVVFQA